MQSTEDDTMRQLGHNLAEERITKQTKKSYIAKVKRITQYLQKTYWNSPSRALIFETRERIKVPLPQETLEAIFGWLATDTSLARPKKKKNIPITDQVNDDDDDVAAAAEDGDDNVNDERSTMENAIPESDPESLNKVTMSASSLSGYRSALLWYYEQNNHIPTQAESKFMSDCYHGYMKRVAIKKQRGIMDQEEGMTGFSFRGYCDLATYFMSMKPWTSGLFSWCYLVLSWNLLSRTETVSKLMLAHFTWVEDCMVVSVAKHKSDQTGEGVRISKHIYANPTNPSICPVLALAVHILCRDRTSTLVGVKPKLFTSGNFYANYSFQF
jgi:hypothetical protein